MNRLLCCSYDTTIDEEQSKHRLKMTSGRQKRSRRKERPSPPTADRSSAFSRVPLLSRLKSVESLSMHVPCACGRDYGSNAKADTNVDKKLSDKTHTMLLKNELFLYVSQDSHTGSYA